MPEKNKVSKEKCEAIAKSVENSLVEPKSKTPLTSTENRIEKNKKILKCIMDLAKLPKIDMKDYKAVEKRIWKYFNFCYENGMPLELNTLAVALGINRRQLAEYIKGNSNTFSTAPLLAQAAQIVEAHTESAIDQDAINTVYGIFKSKALFGYQENSKITIEKTTENENEKSDEELREEFLKSVDEADYDIE